MKKEFQLSQPWKTFTIEAFLFSLTLALGIFSAFKIDKILKIQKIFLPQISFLEFILNFLLITIFILFVVKFIKFKIGRGLIFKILFIFATFFGGEIFLSVLIGDIFALFLMAILIFWWLKKPSVLNQDILMILGIVGTGSILGLSLKPEFIILLLIIFSIYDFIAVYKTKHMVEMAKEMIEERAILAFIIPLNISGFKENLEKVQISEGERKFLILGGGDVAFPLIFCSSLIPFGISKSLIVAIFSLVGLFIGFYFFITQKVRQPIPALPPIALFSIIGFLITRLFKL